MSPDLAIALLALTYVAEALLWLYHKVRPNAGPVFA